MGETVETGGATVERKRKKAMTRTEDLVRRIEGAVLSGAVLPGTRLDEQTLAARFDVSRTPVREALRQLASSGLVQIRPHHGAVVRQLTIPELLEMFQVVAELEGLAARLAARRITRQGLSKLRQSHETCKRHAESREEEAFFAENNRLHEIVLLASRNKFLIDQVHEMTRRVIPYRRYVTQQPGVMEKSVDEHAAVVAAIESGAGAAAHDLMRSHLNMIGEEAGDFVTVLSTIGKSPHDQAGESRPPSATARADRINGVDVGHRPPWK